MHPIPPHPLPPDRTPDIRTPEDLHQQWRALIGPLGFSKRELWLSFITGAGRPLPILPVINDIPVHPASQTVRNIVGCCVQIVADEADDQAAAAFLLARPGPGQLTESDRSWGRALEREASRQHLLIKPFFVATDDAVLPLTPPPIAA